MEMHVKTYVVKKEDFGGGVDSTGQGDASLGELRQRDNEVHVMTNLLSSRESEALFSYLCSITSFKQCQVTL
jgi:hypothetical protein